ncbi:TPA: type 4b pilus CFA/III assembly ATPase CofH, partial [Escherichia coli]|nr:type 4b pilus CFA/III assembly ATPase CofH [Escherichia coli]
KNMMEWMQINRYDDKGCFLTVEDPVEYQIYGAKQSSVLDGENGGFHSAIKSSLRRDPDVLMVGEIRDPVSSNALAGAVESGHYCFTTVHAGNIVTLLQRLSALGISSDKLSTPGFIAGLQCQKLIPVLCDNCKLEYAVNILGRRFTLCKVNESGCERCKNTGVKSRQLVMEYLIPTQRELEALANQHWLNVYSIWREKRFTSSGISEGFSIKEKVFMHVLRKRACYQWFIMEFGEVPDTDMEVLLEKIQ